MIESLSVEGFRIFQSFEVEGFAQVNLFTGKNNVGKTSMLDAVYLLGASDILTALNDVIHKRGRSIVSNKKLIGKDFSEIFWGYGEETKSFQLYSNRTNEPIFYLLSICNSDRIG